MFQVTNRPNTLTPTTTSDGADAALGIYVHWPFCLSKCPYCDFNSHVRAEIDQDRWRAALVRELQYYASLTSNRTVTSIFFGGGTPSLMPPQTVGAVIDAIHDLWPVQQNIEITLEANPTSIEREKFRAFRAAGVNRVSVGVQSLRDDDLAALGRTHSAREARKAIETAESIFARYSFDLIYARSGQKLSDWEAELSAALPYARGHMSLYQLTIEPGTAFYTRHKRGDLPIPEDETAAAFYDLTNDMMSAAGLPPYEVSNYAAPGQESAHNLTYWHYGEYIGAGPGAHGRVCVDGRRQATRARRGPEIWLKQVEAEGHGAHPFNILSDRTQAEEWLMMGLRLYNGISLADCPLKTGYDAADLIDFDAVTSLCHSGHLHLENDVLKATNNGMLCLNAILARIIDWPDV